MGRYSKTKILPNSRCLIYKTVSPVTEMNDPKKMHEQNRLWLGQ